MFNSLYYLQPTNPILNAQCCVTISWHKHSTTVDRNRHKSLTIFKDCSNSADWRLPLMALWVLYGNCIQVGHFFSIRVCNPLVISYNDTPVFTVRTPYVSCILVQQLFCVATVHVFYAKRNIILTSVVMTGQVFLEHWTVIRQFDGVEFEFRVTNENEKGKVFKNGLLL